ncbi:unnamed protein product [Ceutorhynchus assimilis]|uniref:Uncharacterized protein n=1 Tax=Ceutorhynchus assimilis TaxID=467358 RepID=A0A9N9MFE7_9CUCU|nr:unnamed protein product [Ceutorhynchus assimilis]
MPSPCDSCKDTCKDGKSCGSNCQCGPDCKCAEISGSGGDQKCCDKKK